MQPADEPRRFGNVNPPPGEIPTDPEVTFDVTNITDSKLISYFNFPNAIHSYYNQGRTFMFGLRGTW